MKKSLTIILGILLIILAVLSYNTIISLYLAIYGFMAILDAVLFLKEYYNKITYIIIMITIVCAMIILYYIFPHNPIIHAKYLVDELSEFAINTQVIGALLLILLMIGSILKLDKYEKILDPHNKKLKSDPENSKALYNKGLALLKLDEYKKAIKIFNKLLNSYPENTNVLYCKGFALQKLKNMKKH